MLTKWKAWRRTLYIGTRRCSALARQMAYERSRYGLVGAMFMMTLAVRAGESKSVFIEDFTWPELKEAIATGANSVLVFSGSVEETGPYVILGKHNYRAHAYADRIARELGRTLVGPIIPAVPVSGGLARYPGTIDVPADIYSSYTAAIVRAMASAGFKHVFLLGDHGGSQKPLEDLAPQLDKSLSPKGTRVYFVGDGYAKATSEIVALEKARGLAADGHGGLWDTAETWAANPLGVRPSLFVAAGPVSHPGGIDANGIQGDSRPATPELGREFAEIRIREAAAEIRTLLAGENHP